MEVSKERIAERKYKRDEYSQKAREEQRHEKFQLGTNPMKMTAFETKLAKKEAVEREQARIKYVLGTQGRDGGCLGSEVDKEYDDLY